MCGRGCISWRSRGSRHARRGPTERWVSEQPELTYPDIVRFARVFLMTVLVTDAIALRPDKPRARGPITPLAEKLFRILLFEFENVLTGLCNPSLATIRMTAGCAESSVK